jgi:hypothetical protein
MSPWLAGGFTVRLAVCHGRVDHDAGWTSVLNHAVRCAGLDVSLATSDELEPGTLLTSVDAWPSERDTTLLPASAVLDDVGGGK